MKIRASVAAIAVLALGFGVTASAQMGMGPRPPQVRGVWNPVVGSGAVYDLGAKNKGSMEIAIVGTESVEGKPGYWLETTTTDPESGSAVYVKQLMVLEGSNTRTVRMIMQVSGQPPMEMPVGMMNRGQAQQSQAADIRGQSEAVGSESITTPGGTFTCQHYRMKDGSGESWIAENVGPWGLVKSTGKDANMLVIKVFTDAKTHITGTPVKFAPM